MMDKIRIGCIMGNDVQNIKPAKLNLQHFESRNKPHVRGTVQFLQYFKLFAERAIRLILYFKASVE